ncbi:ABC transporter ATP-binding protein/permease [Haloplasma contractile]|uniref:Macrolide transport system ATP-binding-permease protein n=1 Tax=Haloplasma contractile SSD-17B TaxID=1033810 RepID=U2E6Z8_9MOLU|nr:ATP-binding cassette domain-containing protein [Haloplasma contractile]ERJ10988.1 macrolide transport system ATP-binding-permease protein [Haloplasma contractile SSD-17B]
MLEIKNITKRYKPKKGVPVTALDNVSLQFQDKGMVFVLGKSGSGKSTLLNIMGGLDQADSGEIIIKGKSSKDFRQSDFDSYRNTYLGFIFQEYNILEEFTVGANIGLALELQGKRATDEEINRIMEEVDMIGFGVRKPNELSGGQKQRVAIARALVKNPEIIMADEPTGALDSKTGIQVFKTLKKLSQDKLVIVVSHDREFAEQYGDRVIEFADGEVISDIEKTLEKPTEKSAGLNIVDDSFISVKKGYKLTSEDVELINNYIENSSQDVIISIDQKTNSDIKKIARIDDEGNKEVFKPTDPKGFLSLNEKNPFKLIKSRLPIKDAVKVGASGLRGRPIRLFFTILLSMISFTLFGLADTMGSYDKVDATVNSIIDSNVQNVSFSKRVEIDDEWSDHTWYRDTTMFKTDLDYIENELGIEVSPIYSTGRHHEEGFRFHDHLLSQSKLGHEYYIQSITGFAELNEEELSKLGFTIYGNLPNDFNEIAITNYIFAHFKEAGFRSKDGREIKAEDVTEDTIVGEQLRLNNEIYTITAIVDTQIDENRYGYLKDGRMGDGFVDYFQIQEFNTVVRYGYHALGFVQPGFIEHKIKNNLGLSVRDMGYLELQGEEHFSATVSHIVRQSDLTDDQIYLLDPNKKSLSSSEILLDANRAIELIKLHNIELPEDEQFDFITTYSDLIQYTVDQAYKEYAKNHYEEAYRQGFSPDEVLGLVHYDEFGNVIDDYEYSDDEKIRYYEEYIRHFKHDQRFIMDDTNFANFESQIRETFIKEHDLLSYINSDDLNFILHGFIESPYSSGIEKEMEPVVAGFFFPSDYMTGDGYYGPINYIVVDDEFYKQFNEHAPGPYSWAIAEMPDDEQGIREVVEFRYNDGADGVEYKLNNAVSYLLDQVNDFIEQGSKVFFYIGVGFAVFSALLLFNFITASIASKKREIGVLRALGARSSDVFSIFFSESLIIALINFVLALILTIGVIIYINTYLRGEYGLLITFLNFGIRQFFLMLVVSTGVALIASFIPVYRIAHKKPIDAIKNR